MSDLSFTIGNSKLGKKTLIFNLPAGKTCPGALFCKSFAVENADGKRTIQDGPQTQFRCFAASGEVQYDGAYNSRKNNLKNIVSYIQNETAASMIAAAVQKNRTRKTELVRIHESGDFFSEAYLNAWIEVAKNIPDLKFYCYSKSLPYFVGKELPNNFYMTASQGGVYDNLILQGLFERYSVVVKNELEAYSLGLEVDHDDSHCFGDKPFALLVHNTQPKGSEWGKAIRERRKNGEFSGYSKK